MAPDAFATQPTNGELGEWVVSDWRSARQVPTTTLGYVLTYETSTYPTADLAAIAELEREVAGRPEHPRRNELEGHKRRLEKGSDKLTMTLSWSHDKLWRLSTTIPYVPTLPYSDCAIGPEAAWMLTPVQLTIMESTGGNAANYDAALQNPSFRSYVNLAFHGGFDLFEGACQPKSWQFIDDEKWRMEATSTDGSVVLEYHGTWRSDVKRGFIDSAECTRSPENSAIGERWVFADWQLLPAVNRFAAHTVSNYKPSSSTPRASWRLLGCETVTRQQVEQAAAVPRADGVDVERGPLTYTRVYDARVNRGMPIAAVTGPALKIDLAADSDRSSSVARVFGWITAVSLAVVLVVLKYRSRTSSRHGSHPHAKGPL